MITSMTKVPRYRYHKNMTIMSYFRPVTWRPHIRVPVCDSSVATVSTKVLPVPTGMLDIQYHWSNFAELPFCIRNRRSASLVVCFLPNNILTTYVKSVRLMISNWLIDSLHWVTSIKHYQGNMWHHRTVLLLLDLNLSLLYCHVITIQVITKQCFHWQRPYINCNNNQART